MRLVIALVVAAALSLAVAVPALAQPPSGSILENRGLESQGKQACVNSNAHHANDTPGGVYVGQIAFCQPGPPGP